MKLKNIFNKKIINIFLSIISYLIFAIILFYIVLSLVAPRKIISIFNYQHFVISTSSMSPTLEVGDIVVVKKIDPNELEKGDIFTYYADINLDGKVDKVTHYFERTEIIDGVTIYRSIRENSTIVDSWVISEEHIIGEVVGKIPGVGKIALFLRSPVGIGVIVVDAILIYFIYKFFKKPKEEKQPEENEKV